MKNFLLSLSGFIYGVIAAAHILRFLYKLPVTIGTYAVPNRVSLWACLVALVLSIACFIARGKK